MSDEMKIPDGLSAGQALVVRHLEGSLAEAAYYIKEADGWKEEGRGEAFIGRNGVGKEREGDGKTPLGVLGVTGAFGFGPAIGTLPYTRITERTTACDSEGPLYNRITEEKVGGEHMIEYPEEYEFGLETDYNRECIYPKGSAIFIHCKGSRPWTGGCIALDRELTERILTTCDPSMKVVIF